VSSCSFWFIILLCLLSRYLDDKTAGVACVVVGAVLAVCLATQYRARQNKKDDK
jgi:hypothetical protein